MQKRKFEYKNIKKEGRYHDRDKRINKNWMELR